MISSPFLISFVFVCSVLSVAGVGLLFDNASFLLLSIINTLVFFVFGVYFLLTKKTKSTSTVQKTSKEAVEDSVEEKPAHHLHQQQFVKYTYHHKKKKNNSVFLILFGLAAAGLLILWINRSALSTTQPSALNIPESLTGYAESILAQKDALSGSTVSGDIIESTGEVLSTGG
ncbi:MAG: hypothetical protein WCO66_05185, partial [Candidatus Absconditabacteria bacterium]